MVSQSSFSKIGQRHQKQCSTATCSVSRPLTLQMGPVYRDQHVSLWTGASASGNTMPLTVRVSPFVRLRLLFEQSKNPACTYAVPGMQYSRRQYACCAGCESIASRQSRPGTAAHIVTLRCQQAGRQTRSYCTSWNMCMLWTSREARLAGPSSPWRAINSTGGRQDPTEVLSSSSEQSYDV